MKKSFARLACALIFLLFSAATAARADVRIRQKMTVGGHTMESEVAIKGQRQRSETEMAPGMKTVQITQCDLKRILNVSDATRKYTVTPLGGDAAATEPAGPPSPATGAPGVSRRGGIVTHVMTMTDTGERKEMFGFTARHIKTSVRMEPSPDACQQEGMSYETDGWYIDFDFNFSCPMDRPQAPPQLAQRADGCQDQIRFRHVGKAKLGYPVQVTTRYLDKNGRETTSMVIEVVGLARDTLDPSLFDVPTGYTETKNPQELYDTAAMMRAMQSARNNNDGDEDRADAGRQTGAGAATPRRGAAVGVKPPGVVRIGVAPLGNRTQQPVDAAVLRAGLVASLEGATVEAVPLDASAPDAALAEAQQKGCDFVLFTDIAALKQSAANKIGGMFGRATGVGAKERFEAGVEYSLVPASGGAALLQSNASAKEDGGADTSVSAALRKEAQAVLAKVRK